MPLNEEERTSTNWLKEAQKGYMRVAVLILLNKKQSHGYEIIKEIRDRTKGFMKPTPGGIYPVLRNLEKAEYIQGGWTLKRNRKIKIYKITGTGNHILKQAMIKQNEIAENVNVLFQEFARDVLNIKPKDFPFHAMPSPFSFLLEDKNQQTTESQEKLKQQRTHIKDAIKTLQSELQQINKQLSKTKKAHLSKPK
jgi:DNA-binding PadR family transcriptional regulator